MTDLDRACPHEHFNAVVAVNRITKSDDDPEVVGYSADITVVCVDCNEPFRWTGLPQGLSFEHPTADLAERTMHAPLRPASADPDFGMGLPGISLVATMRDDGPPEEPNAADL